MTGTIVHLDRRDGIGRLETPTGIVRFSAGRETIDQLARHMGQRIAADILNGKLMWWKPATN